MIHFNIIDIEFSTSIDGSIPIKNERIFIEIYPHSVNVFEAVSDYQIGI